MRTLIAFSLLCIATFTFGQAPASEESQQAKDIRALMICTSDILGNFEMKTLLLKAANGDSSAHDQYNARRQSMLKCTDETFPAAVKAAGDNADLKAAVKEMYLKERDYIVVLGRNEGPAERARSEARDRVLMEMKVAGIK